MFRLLKLKPPNGWHSVGWELLIVTLGVLIALGAQQAVEWARDRQLADQTRSAITEEINQNLVNVSLRAGAERCIQRRLWELHALIQTWGRTGTFETPLWVAQAPRLSIGLPRYEAALDAGYIALLSREEQYRLGTVVAGLTSFQDVQEAENNIWPTLRMLQDGADTLSSTDRTEVRLALQRASALDYTARLLIRQSLPRASNFGFKPDRKRFDEYAKNIWKNGRYTPAICAPIDTPPAKANEMTGQQTPLPF